VINARNWDSDLENFEKLGEPMVSLQARLLEGTTATVLFMPVRMENHASSPGSRLHFGLPGFPLPDRVMVDAKGDLTTSAFGPQAALYVRQVIGSADLGLHLLEHMDRSQPWIGDLKPALLFQTVRQVGATYQHVLGPLIVKVESVYRSFVALRHPETSPYGAPPDRDHGAVALGLEYGIGHDGGSESTLLLEGQAILGVKDEEVLRRLTPFQRDVLAGYRFVLNDEAGREAMVGVLVDLDQAKGIFKSGDGGEYVAIASYQQRVGETWTLKAGLRLFQARRPSTPFDSRGLQPLRHADHVRLSLTRHF
jgi:hypothetical protein